MSFGVLRFKRAVDQILSGIGGYQKYLLTTELKWEKYVGGRNIHLY